MDKEKYKEMYEQIYKCSNLSLIGMVKFAIELQLYIFIRNSRPEHKKRSFFKGYSKTQKINAAKNLLSILEGQSYTYPISKTGINALLDGSLGVLCLKNTKLLGFKNV